MKLFLCVILLCINIAFINAEIDEPDKVHQQEKKKLKQYLPKKVEHELGVYLDSSIKTMPFYVQVMKPKNNQIRIIQFFADGSGGKPEVFKYEKGEIHINRFDYYKLEEFSLSVWDDYGKIHDLTPVRVSKK